MISNRLKSYALNRSMMLVDDDQSILQLFGRIFSRVFKNVYLASNGREGVEMYEEKKPDLVITDITMPEMDGIAMLKLIREMDKHSPIVVITGHNEEKYHKILSELEVPCIIKPIDRDQLWEVLENLLLGPLPKD